MRLETSYLHLGCVIPGAMCACVGGWRRHIFKEISKKQSISLAHMDPLKQHSVGDAMLLACNIAISPKGKTKCCNPVSHEINILLNGLCVCAS